MFSFASVLDLDPSNGQSFIALCMPLRREKAEFTNLLKRLWQQMFELEIQVIYARVFHAGLKRNNFSFWCVSNGIVWKTTTASNISPTFRLVISALNIRTTYTHLQPTKKYPYLPMPFKWISIKTIPLWNCSVVGIQHSITITITIITSTLARPRSVQLSSSTCTLCTVFVVDWMCVLKCEPNTIYLH